MECVREMGFGALEHLSTTNMSKQLMMELVDCFNTKDNTMRTTLGTVKLDATKGATPKILRKIVVETKPNSEENTRKFKRAFILYVQKVFLCANNNMPLSPKHFPPIVDVDNTSEMNWGCHVYSVLLDGIIDMRRRNLKGVEGCVFALLIIYMHETHFRKDSEHEKARPPWIKYWKGERLQKRIRVEKKDSTGLLYQANQRKGVTKKEKSSGLKIGKKEALATKLVKSMEMQDDPKGKQKLGKRKHAEDDDESEEEFEDVSSESKSENRSESEPGSEETDSEDENTNKETAPIHEDVQVTPQDCAIEVVEATSAEEQIIMQDLSKSDANVDAQIHEDVQVTPLDSGIEVVHATSAEEELISRELSNNIETLVVSAATASSHGTAARPLHRHRRSTLKTLVVSVVAPSRSVLSFVASSRPCPPSKARTTIKGSRQRRLLLVSDRPLQLSLQLRKHRLDSSPKCAPPSVLKLRRPCSLLRLVVAPSLPYQVSSRLARQQQEMEPQFDISSSGNIGEDVALPNDSASVRSPEALPAAPSPRPPLPQRNTKKVAVRGRAKRRAVENLLDLDLGLGNTLLKIQIVVLSILELSVIGVGLAMLVMHIKMALVI
ncbi:hypothetical protein PIB30_008532 [Stylosanthes scabra]|uniref:Ubiquitin-like protease family profile domain-containing protein n=1 Tax=Stylosanthes scabra TaxID=79078 RepID=A0ABU6Z3P2_9FABA|nr:hypothetical protein [Stylosanthes scabra]